MNIEERQSLQQKVYIHLKQAINEQLYKPGDILNERKISAELDVSRTPVREAFKALEAEDIVEYIPYRGVMVKSISVEDLKHIFQIREALEVLVIKLAIDKINNETIRRLQQCVQAQEHLKDSSDNRIYEFIRLDMEFHNILADTSDNKFLKQLILDMRDKVARLGVTALYSGPQRFKETIDEHRQIVSALKADDSKLSLEAMEQHIQNTYDNAMRYIESLKK